MKLKVTYTQEQKVYILHGSCAGTMHVPVWVSIAYRESFKESTSLENANFKIKPDSE